MNHQFTKETSASTITSTHPEETIKFQVAKWQRQEDLLSERQEKLAESFDCNSTMYDGVNEVIGSSYNDIHNLCKLYKLQPATQCLFDMIFRHYLSVKLTKILDTVTATQESCQNTSQGLPSLNILKVDALLCLRLAIKMKECQVDMYKQ